MKRHFLALLAIAIALPVSASPSLPAPVSEDVLTFQQVEQRKTELKDRIVKVEIERLLGEGNKLDKGMLRYIAKDTSKSATPYGQIAFPRDGLQKLGLIANPEKGPFTVYVQVHVFTEQASAAALSIAVGTNFAAGKGGKGSYSW
jgi:hypothetical protein